MHQLHGQGAAQCRGGTSAGGRSVGLTSAAPRGSRRPQGELLPRCAPPPPGRAGIGFSDFPSTCAGIAVLTRAHVQAASIWFFLQPLAWGVWALWLGLTGGRPALGVLLLRTGHGRVLPSRWAALAPAATCVPSTVRRVLRSRARAPHVHGRSELRGRRQPVRTRWAGHGWERAVGTRGQGRQLCMGRPASVLQLPCSHSSLYSPGWAGFGDSAFVTAAMSFTR